MQTTRGKSVVAVGVVFTYLNIYIYKHLAIEI